MTRKKKRQDILEHVVKCMHKYVDTGSGTRRDLYDGSGVSKSLIDKMMSTKSKAQVNTKTLQPIIDFLRDKGYFVIYD